MIPREPSKRGFLVRGKLRKGDVHNREDGAHDPSGRRSRKKVEIGVDGTGRATWIVFNGIGRVEFSTRTPIEIFVDLRGFSYFQRYEGYRFSNRHTKRILFPTRVNGDNQLYYFEKTFMEVVLAWYCSNRGETLSHPLKSMGTSLFR